MSLVGTLATICLIVTALLMFGLTVSALINLWNNR